MPNPVVIAIVTALLAAKLPTFEDFRRMDRDRRESGQLNTAESLELTRIDPKLIRETVKARLDDPEVLLGAIELLPSPRPGIEFRTEGKTNVVFPLRVALAYASNAQYDAALFYLRWCQQADNANGAPWLAELWVRQEKEQSLKSFSPAPSAVLFNGYEAEAARARIRVLEMAGYTRYSARRLAILRASEAHRMVQDIAKRPIEPSLAPFLLVSARAIQDHPTLIITELVGQSLERAVLMSRPNGYTDKEVAERFDQMATRRALLQALVASIERDTIDLATESEMIGYFDNMLTLGEEDAMKRLASAVRDKPTGP